MKMNKVQRTFSIGDYWIYYKIYCGVNIADNILINIIKPITEHLIQNKIINKWFFIRYSDPESHLRVRFLLNDLKDFGIIVKQIKEALSSHIEGNSVWNVELNTYNRELERYGKNTIEESESLFYHDSIMITSAIKNIKDDNEYFVFILKAVNDILIYFNYSDKQKLDFVHHLDLAFKKEFNVDKTLKKQLNIKYRTWQKPIEKLISTDNKNEFYGLHYNKTVNSESVIKNLISHNKNNTLQIDCNELLSSYIHMTINRGFSSKQRLHEMLIYNMLYRFYKSKIGRKLK